MSKTLTAELPPPDLYISDTVAWAREQARLLRERRFTEVDWEHVIEEIDDVGNRYEDELESRLTTIIEHWLKLELSSAEDPRRGWVKTVHRDALEVQALLNKHRFLARPELFRTQFERARRLAIKLAATELMDRYEVKSAAYVREAAERITPDSLLDETRWPTA